MSFDRKATGIQSFSNIAELSIITCKILITLIIGLH